MTASPLYRILVRLPDRPGALGAAASRIGALRGDVIGFEILQRGTGGAMDEFVVALPAEVPLELLTRELVDDGVTVLDIVAVAVAPTDPVVAGLKAGARLAECSDAETLLVALIHEAACLLRADWVVVVGPDPCGPPLGEWGVVPPGTVVHSGVDAGIDSGRVARPIASLRASIVAGREAPFGSGEEYRLAALTDLAEVVLRRQ